MNDSRRRICCLMRYEKYSIIAFEYVGGLKSKCNSSSLVYSVRLQPETRQPLPIDLKRCRPAQRFSRPTIHQISDFVQVFLVVARQIRTLR